MPNIFLLNANLSHKSAEYLVTLGYDAKTVTQHNLRHASDQVIAQYALRKKLIIITLDLDFGQIYYQASDQKIGVIILRLSDQSVESVNATLLRLHNSGLFKKSLAATLVLVGHDTVRVRKG